MPFLEYCCFLATHNSEVIPSGWKRSQSCLFQNLSWRKSLATSINQQNVFWGVFLLLLSSASPDVSWMHRESCSIERKKIRCQYRTHWGECQAGRWERRPGHQSYSCSEELLLIKIDEIGLVVLDPIFVDNFMQPKHTQSQSPAAPT